MPRKNPPARAFVPAALTLTLLLCLGLGLVPVTRSSSRTPQTPADWQAAQAVSEVRKVALVTKDILVDPATQLVYASLPGSAGPNGNSVVTVDPATGTVGTPVFVGSEPNILAFSADRKYLYVGLDGESAVRRFDMATQTAGLRVPLGAGEFGVVVYAEDIKVMPGAPETIAVSRRAFPANGSSHQGVVIYDGDVPRPVTTDRTRSNNFIEFGPSGTTLYGFDAGNAVLRRLSVNDSGVTIDPSAGISLSEYGDIELSNGFIYHSSGRVVNASTFALAGKYEGMSVAVYYPTRAVAVDEPNDRVYFITNNPRFSPDQPISVTLWAYQKSTFQLMGTTVVTGVGERVSHLVRWGNRGLAFRDDQNVYFVRTDLVPGSETIPTPTPTPTATPTPGPGDPTPTPTATPSPTPTPSSSPTPVPTPGPGEFRSLGLTTKDLVTDVNSQTIFASVPPTAGASQNSVIAFDPATGNVTRSTVVGSNPNKLAISDDGQYVYVGLDGEFAVARYDVATGAAGPKFLLGEGTPDDISVMPGSPNVVAVSRASWGIAVYENGVKRDLVAGAGDGAFGVEFSNSPSVLYTSASGSSLGKLTVGACGAGLALRTPGLINGLMRYDNGRVYTSNGRVIDAEAGTLVGTFDVPVVSGVSQGPVFTTDSKAGRIYLIYSDGTSLRLRVFDMQTLVVLGELRLPGVTGGQVTSLVRWGANGLAFRTDGLVYVLQHQLVAPPVPPPFTPAPPAAPLNFTVRGGISALNTSTPGVTVNYGGARNGSTQTDANGRFSVADLPLCSTLTVTPSKPFWTFTPASVTITNPSVQAANFSSFHNFVGFVVTQTSANESQHKVGIPILRAVTPAQQGAATVRYTVTPGTASERSDYTGTSGTFHFDPGVAQSGFEILLTDDVFVEGPETFTVTLSDVQGMEAELIDNVITVTINDNDTVQPVTSPLQDPIFFVRRHYQDFLGRDPSTDPVGFAFWVNEIAGCNAEPDPQLRAACLAVKRINVSAAFFLAIEFQQTGYLVHRLYASSYPASAARPRGLPRFAEFMRDTREVGRGVIVGQFQWEQKLEANKQAFLLDWVARPEFLAEHPLSQGAGDYVDSLFRNAGAQPTAEERAAAVAAFGAGGAQGRAAALRSVAESKSVFDRQLNQAFVLMQYFGYLRRDPDAAPDSNFSGYQFWLDKLNEFHGNYIEAEMVKAFLESTEYQQRFGPANFDLSK